MLDRLLIFTAHVGGWLFVLLFWLFAAGFVGYVLSVSIYTLGVVLP